MLAGCCLGSFRSAYVMHRKCVCPSCRLRAGKEQTLGFVTRLVHVHCRTDRNQQGLGVGRRRRLGITRLVVLPLTWSHHLWITVGLRLLVTRRTTEQAGFVSLGSDLHLPVFFQVRLFLREEAGPGFTEDVSASPSVGTPEALKDSLMVVSSWKAAIVIDCGPRLPRGVLSKCRLFFWNWLFLPKLLIIKVSHRRILPG